MSLVTDANRKWWTLAAVTFSLFMVMLDTTIVNVALPTIQVDLKIRTQSELEWTVNAFLLTYAVLLLPGGKLADYLGRKRFLLIGVAVFTVSSLVCGLASSGAMLIGARAVQGVGAALMMPATHSLISANFEESEHGLAYGVWAGFSTLGLALGPLIGGLLVQHADWPWIFYVNVPLGAVAVVFSWLVVRESKDTSTEQGLDPPGSVISTAALFALVFALTEGNGYGWTSRTILVCFGVAALGFVTFVLLEAKQRKPMMDLGLFRNGTFAGANVVTMLIMLAMLGVLFFVSIYLQTILHYSAVQTGATFLPMTLIFLLVSPVAGILGDKLGFRWPVAAGMALLGVALVVFSRVNATSSFRDLLPALVIGGIGMGIATAPVTAAAMTATPLDKAGVGAGVLVSFRQTGGSLGIAIMGALVATKVGDLHPGTPAYVQPFVAGFQNALLAAAGFAFLGAVVAALSIRGISPVPVVAATGERLLRRFATGALGGVPSPTVVRQAVQRAQAAAVREELPALIVNEGPLAGYRYPVDAELSIGREQADIILNDPQISRRHALLRPVDGTCEIADLGSFNGTFVNDERIEKPRRLDDGDVVKVGKTSFNVVVPRPARGEATIPAGVALAEPPVLAVSDGPLAGQRFPIRVELSIGRENADIILDDREVSRLHALVRAVDGGCEIADVGSVNGTFVNGERIDRPRRLADGDVVRVGKTSLEVELPAALRAEPTIPAVAAVSEPPALVFSDGPSAGTRIPVEAELSLGREQADITIDDPEVSRRHALLRPIGGTCEIADAGSANGTFVNEERIDRPRRLAHGDVVRLGKTSLRFEVRAGAAATVISPARSRPTVLRPGGTGEGDR
jgi:EmrB/QacA subfamily drug resistance transporter